MKNLPMQQHIFVIDLNDIAPADETKFTQKMSDLLKEKSSYFGPCFPFFSKSRVDFWLVCDDLFYETTASYNAGLLNTEEFYKKIRYELGLQETSDLATAWEEMCLLSPEQLERICQLFKKAPKGSNAVIVILCPTNEIHFSSIKKQIEKYLWNQEQESLDDYEVQFTLSYTEKLGSYELLLAHSFKSLLKNEKFDKFHFDCLTKEIEDDIRKQLTEAPIFFKEILKNRKKVETVSKDLENLQSIVLTPEDNIAITARTIALEALLNQNSPMPKERQSSPTFTIQYFPPKNNFLSFGTSAEDLKTKPLTRVLSVSSQLNGSKKNT